MMVLEILTAIYGGFPMEFWLFAAIVPVFLGASLWIALGKIDEEN